MSSVKVIKIDDVEYIRADAVGHAPIGPEVIIRTYASGVHVGTLESAWKEANTPVTLKNARRIWKWSGANTLNEIATRGLNRKASKISEPVPEIQLVPIEVIPVASGLDLSAIWNG